MEDEDYELMKRNSYTIKKLEQEKVIEYVHNWPWSGYYIKDTCLVMRESERYAEEWHINTRRYNIVCKSISPPDSLEKCFPPAAELIELDKYGKRVDDEFSRTPYC